MIIVIVIVRARSSDAGPAAERRYLTVSVPYMPAARWPGTSQKNVYLPGLRLSLTDVVALRDEGAGGDLRALGGGAVFAGFEGDVVHHARHVGHRHGHRPRGRRRPSWRCRRAGPRGSRRSPACRAFSTAGLPAPGASTAARQQAGVGPGAVGGFFDVGGDVPRGRAADESFRHRARRVRVGDLVFDHAADRVAPEPFFDALAEGDVEVRARRSLWCSRGRACGRRRTWPRTAAYRRSGWRCRRP